MKRTQLNYAKRYEVNVKVDLYLHPHPHYLKERGGSDNCLFSSESRQQRKARSSTFPSYISNFKFELY